MVINIKAAARKREDCKTMQSKAESSAQKLGYVHGIIICCS
jgi:hypothetical protein